MPQVRKAIRDACEERAKHFEEKAAAFRNGRIIRASTGVPPTIPAYAEVRMSDAGSLYINVPNDPEKLNYVRDRFRKYGWEVDDFEVSDWGHLSADMRLPDKKNPDNEWRNRNSGFISASDYRDGATCTTVKIGTILEEVDVWETRCTEEEEDE